MGFLLTKRIEIAGSHCLALPYASPCANMHGHNWIVTVEIAGNILKNGMLLDFTTIKKVVMKLDHSNLNDCISQPTAENIAKYIAEELLKEMCLAWTGVSITLHPTVKSVTVQESEGNTICYCP